MRIREIVQTFRRRRFLTGLVLLVMFLATLFGAFSYAVHNRMIDIYMRENFEQSQQRLALSYDTVNYALLSIYRSCYTMLYNDKDILYGITNPEVTPMEQSRIRTKLSRKVTENPLIASIYLINGKHDRVYASNNVTASIDAFADHRAIELFEQHASRPFLTPRKYAPARAAATVDYITFVLANYGTNRRLTGGLVVNLNADALASLLLQVGEESGGALFLLDTEGTVLCQSEGRFVGDDLRGMPFYAQMESMGASGTFVAPFDGVESLLTHRKADSGAFDFINLSVVPYSGITLRAQRITRLFQFFFAAFALAGGGVTSLMIYRMYTPLSALVRTVRGASGGAQGELETIESRYTQMLDVQHTLQSELNREHARALVRQMLGGAHATEEGIYHQLHSAGIQFTLESFIVTVGRYAPERRSLDTIRRTRAALLSALSAHAPARCRPLTITLDDASMAVIFNTERMPETSSAISSVLRAVNEALRAEGMPAFRWGVGTPVQFPSDIHLSFERAVRALSYRLLFDAPILTFDAIREQENVPREYPAGLEKEIIADIRRGRLPSDAIGAFLGALSRQSVTSVRMALQQLLLAIAQQDHAHAADDEPGLSYQEELQALSTAGDIGQARDTLTRYASAVAQGFGAAAASRHGPIMRGIERYIAGSLGDPSLGAASVAAHANLSVSHTGRLFKAHRDESVSAYISRLRIDEACRLLRETNLPIKDIAVAVGIMDYQYFSQVFKRKTGMTANEYRRAENA